MKDYVLSNDFTYHSTGSSEGTQVKYYKDGKWFKQDLNGYESNSEYIISCLLDCSNISNYVSYEKCLINGKDGCVSKSFLGHDESFITFERLHQSYTGRHMLDEVMLLNSPEEKIRYVKDFISTNTGLDVSSYLSDIFSLDALTLNYDRHFNNLGIIYDSLNDKYHEAPIFDNGAGLLSNISRFPFFNSIEENILNVIGQPICSNLDLQAYYAGITLKVDYDLFERTYLSILGHSRAIDVLCYQLEQKRSLFPDFVKYPDLEEER